MDGATEQSSITTVSPPSPAARDCKVLAREVHKMMHRREVREFISPLLQPPLNRLFVPRPTLDYLPPISSGTEGRAFINVVPTSHFVDLLSQTTGGGDSLNSSEQARPQPSKQQVKSEKRRAVQEKLEADLASWNPSGAADTTGDAFKTLFVGRLPYDITEGTLRREFERFGPITRIKLVVRNDTGASRGYAFIEFEREKDMKVAYVEADAMRIDSRRIVVDVERGRTVKGWKPRRLGGGLGRTRVGGKEENQRHSGRDPRANDMLEQLVKAGHYIPRKRSPSPLRHRDDPRHPPSRPPRHPERDLRDDRHRR